MTKEDAGIILRPSITIVAIALAVVGFAPVLGDISLFIGVGTSLPIVSILKLNLSFLLFPFSAGVVSLVASFACVRYLLVAAGVEFRDLFRFDLHGFAIKSLWWSLVLLSGAYMVLWENLLFP